MAGRKGWLKYHTIGAVALDTYYASTAKPLPQEKPQREPVRRQEEPRPQDKGGISLFALIGGAVCAFLLVLAIFGGSRVAALQRQKAALAETVAALEAERDTLQTQFDSTVDLASIATQARLMGMRGADQSQRIPVSVPEPEETAAPEEKTENPFSLVWQAIADTAKSLVEYLRAD